MKYIRSKNAAYFSIFALILSVFLIEKGEKDLIGKSTDLVGIPPETLKPNHVILVFMPSCSHCQKAAQKLQKQYVKTKNITALTSNEFDKDIKRFRDSLNITFPIVTIEKPQLRKYFKKIPKYVLVQNGIVEAIADSLQLN